MVAAPPAAVEQQPEQQAPSNGNRTALALIVTSHAVQHFYVAGLALTYPLVVAEFHISYGLLGVVLTVAGVVGGLLQGAAGFLHKVSARAILGLQNVCLAGACVMAAVLPGFALFGLARCIGALVSWPQHPVGSAYLSERFPARRGTVLSWHTAGGSLGTVIVPLFATAVIAAAGWRWALVAIAIPMALGGVLVLAKLPSDHSHADAEGTPGTDGSLRARPTLPLLTVLRHRRVLLVLIASTVAAGGRGLGTVSTFVPAYLESDLHMGQYQVGVIFTVLLAASVAGPLLAGYLADRIGRSRLVIVAYAFGALALVGFVTVGANVAALAAIGAAVGILAYAESPLLQALFADSANAADQRAAFGVFFAIAYGIGALWLAALGWIIDHLGFPAAFWTMALSFIAAGVLVAFSAAPKEAASPRP